MKPKVTVDTSSQAALTARTTHDDPEVAGREVRALAAAGLVLLAIDLAGEVSIVVAPTNPVIAWLARAVDTDYVLSSPGFAYAQALSLIDIAWLVPLYLAAYVGLWRLRSWGFFLALACAPALLWNVMTDMATDLLRGFVNVRSVPFYLLFWVPYLALPGATLAVLWRRRALLLATRMGS